MKPYRALAAAWIFALTLLHLWMIGSGRWPLSGDEAHYWEWSRRLDWSYYSKGPLVAYLIALSTRIGGHTEFWVRFPAVVLGAVTAACGYVLTRRVFQSERAAFLAVVLLSVMPLYAIGAVLMTIDAPFVCCWALAWLCLSGVRQREGHAAWYAAGLIFGLGLLSKYTMFMLPPCVALWLAMSPRLRHWFQRKEPYEALFLGLVIFSPVVVWNARHGWYSLHHVLLQANSGGGRTLLATAAGGPEFFASQLGVISPPLFFLLAAGAVWACREGIRRERDALVLLACGSIPVFLFFQGWSFFSKVQGNWAAYAYFTAAVATAGWCERRFAPGVSRRTRTRLNRWLSVSIMLPVLVVPFGFFPESLEWAGVRIPPAWDLVSKRLRGWPELGRAVGEAVRETPQPAFIATDRYQVASLLAFYVPGQPTVYNANFWRRMNQYDIWGGWETLIGRDGVFVMENMPEPPDILRAAFATVERVRTVVIAPSGRPLHTFMVFRGQGFRGFPSRPFAGF